MSSEMSAAGSVRLAIDIGGTFTDLAAVDRRTGRLVLAKADSTPGRFEAGVLRALERSGLDPIGVAAFVHGTTVVVNAVTERRGAATALVTTRGFRDVLEIGRANRPDLYNLSYAKPQPFVPRRHRLEVTERMSYRGEVLVPLVEEEIDPIAQRLREDEIEAVAVCFLHAWTNPEHERRAGELLGKLLPGVEIVVSHEVSGEWREYERSSTVVLSAFVKPVVSRYLASLRDELRAAGVGGPLHAMRSSGGVSSFERAAAAPIALLESGPVAGVTAAAELGRRLGAEDVLALDIGGTTAKTSAIRGGRVRIETLHHVERTPSFAGYPVQTLVVEIVEIGAGGGSIAWAGGSCKATRGLQGLAPTKVSAPSPLRLGCRRRRRGVMWDAAPVREEAGMKALVVIDMLNDFVTGKIANPRAERIMPNVQELLARARADRREWLVVYANDAHMPNDFELKVWGEHAMARTPGAEIISELAAEPGDFVLPKRTYSSFHETGLDPLLRQFGATILVLTGQHTNICLRHTTADAFFRGYEVIVPRDAVEAISEEDHESGLRYLEAIYKADLPYTKELMER